MSDLPTNIDTTYDDDAGDASVKAHQQHHDALHAVYNDIAGASPDLANLGIAGDDHNHSGVYDPAGSAAAAQAAAVQRANHTGTQAQSTVTNLVADLAAKAPLASPALTGNPTAPTQTAGDNSTKIATTAYVDAASGTSAVNVVGATGATETLAFASGLNQQVHDVTMDEDCTFSFSGAPSSGTVGSMTVIVRGAFSPTWPAAVEWSGGTTPTYAAPSVYEFFTVDGGTSVFGFLAGAAFS